MKLDLSLSRFRIKYLDDFLLMLQAAMWYKYEPVAYYLDKNG